MGVESRRVGARMQMGKSIVEEGVGVGNRASGRPGTGGWTEGGS